MKVSKAGRLLVVLACAAMVVTACGDDDDTTASPETTASPDTTGSGGDDTADEGGAAEFTITREGIDGPAEIAGGTVEVTVNDETGGTEMELDFVRVEEGTSEEAFREMFAVIFEGGPIDEALLDIAGVALPTGETTVTESVSLPAGEYFVFSELDDVEEDGEDAPEGDEGEAPEDGEDAPEGGEDAPEGGEGDEDPTANMILTPLTVTEGGGDEVPESAGGTIVASEYTFDTSGLEPGAKFTFSNEGPDQIHHAVLMDFGDLDPATVEEHFPAFLESEGGDMPAEFEGLEEEELFGLGGSGVFSPGRSGTFTSELEEGSTYVAVCFIQDRTGGPPHAIAHDMWKVFTVGS
jgi:hypothetical protein